MSLKALTTIFLLLFFVVLPLGIFAQTYSGFSGNITLTVTPEFPRAHEEVTVTVQGFSVDLDRAEVSWVLNGALKKKAVGARSFSFTTGALGQTSSLEIIVVSPSQGLFKGQIAVRPAEVDILWEADTYIPPFYRGKALPSSRSSIRLSAVPFLAGGNGVLLKPASLVYSWEQDGKKLTAASGFGKQTVFLEGPRLYQESIVSVEVSSLDGSITAKKTIFFDPTTPLVAFYEKHPLRGIVRNQTLSANYLLQKDEFSLRAEPYFFPLAAYKNRALEFEWTVNTQKVLSQKQGELVLRKESQKGGSSRVELKIRDLEKLLQAAATMVVQF